MQLRSISNNCLPHLGFSQSYQSKSTPSRIIVLKEANFHFRDLFSWVPFFNSKPKNSRYKSIIDRLENPKKHSVSVQEIEKFLNDVENGTFEKVATDKEILRATNLLINYARQGTSDSIEQKILERDVNQLFVSEGVNASVESLSCNYLPRTLCACYHKNGKKSNIFKKFGNFVKKHRKAIIITAVAVVAVAIVAAAAVIIVSGAGAAEGAAAGGGALAGVIGASQAKKDGGDIENEPSNKQIIEELPLKKESEIIVNPSEESCGKIGKLIQETLVQNQPAADANMTNLQKPFIGIVPENMKEKLPPAQAKDLQSFFPFTQAHIYEKMVNQAIENQTLLTISNPVCNPINLPPSRLKQCIGFDEMLLRLPLETDTDGLPYAEPHPCYSPAIIISCGEKVCQNKRSAYINGMLNTFDFARNTTEAMSKMQNGNKVDLIYNNSLGLERDLIKQVYIKKGYSVPASGLLKDYILDSLKNPKAILHLSASSQGGAILKELLPDIPSDHRARMYVETYGTAGYIEAGMVEQVTNYWHPNDLISKMADPAGWEKAKNDGTLVILEDDGKFLLNAHSIMDGYAEILEKNHKAFADMEVE